MHKIKICLTVPKSCSFPIAEIFVRNGIRTNSLAISLEKSELYAHLTLDAVFGSN